MSKHLKEISKMKSNGLYKYYFGETHNYGNALLLLKRAKSFGYKSSFISVFKDNKLYSLKKYLDEYE